MVRMCFGGGGLVLVCLFGRLSSIYIYYSWKDELAGLVFQTRIEGSVWVCTRVLLDSSSHWSHPRDLLSCRRALGSQRSLGGNPSEKTHQEFPKGKGNLAWRGKIINLIFYHPHSSLKVGFIYLYMCMCVPMSKCASVPVEARRRYWISWSWGTGDCELLGFELESSLLSSKHSLALLLFETELNFPAWLEFTM